MINFNLLAGISLGYVALLFLVAALAERRALRAPSRWLRSPLIYTLSLSIYCTAWTFYGAVGYAARSGLEYLTIYLGPSLVMLGWWWILRKLVRIGRTQRITSIADLISSRFGKSTSLGVIVTLLCVVGITPYIALQLQSLALSFGVFAGAAGADWERSDFNSVALWAAVGLTLFTVLFGTRNLDSSERHNGVVTAIALEAVVKLAALLAVGIFVVWGLGGGPTEVMDRIAASEIGVWDQSAGRWMGLTFLAAAAFLCLPRMFHVLVVENSSERHLLTASWAFPLYVLLMSLFVVPIAVVGLELMPEGANPDLFVLTVPLSQGQEGLATLAFLGGFSSATSMVIVATIALATMVSNHIVLPLWLSSRPAGGAMMSGDVRAIVLVARRFSIAGVLALGYIYYYLSGGSGALASIGLIAFVGLAQILPAMIGGIFWRGATRTGAALGLVLGFVIWLWTLFLPSFGEGAVMSTQVMTEGPFGIAFLRPEALFGTMGLDPILHATFWSLFLNTFAFVVGSLVSFPTPIERLQGAQFVNVFEHSPGTPTWKPAAGQAEDLLIMSQRILGANEAQEAFERAAVLQGKTGFLPDVTPEFVQSLERQLSGSVGAATAHAMVSQVTEGSSVSVQDLMAVADEAAQILEYSSKLEAKSDELERTARALSDANEKLTALSIQKDAFLSQISHELRTPMTSIRSFSEILRDGDLDPDAQERYAQIIHSEAERLTRLLDNLLDLTVLENGQGVINREQGQLRDLLDRAVSAACGEGDRLLIRRDRASETLELDTDLDRLVQVFINLIANALKYCDAERPELKIQLRRLRGAYVIDFIDNGSGIPSESQDVIFEKFSRLGDQARAGGAGLGLAICREVMERLGGRIAYLPAQGGAAFRVWLPQAQAMAAQ
ncbi:sodium:solute symporter [Ponticoccus sp. SC2-23]|uniref:ATP-binding protein n=1 Tax=Alexandriicola marinus TaxID=2081710 RepID=UPI000FD7B0CD|nr:ATP-binding protein [Alexandriicola marinus]MBM1219530.1 sodium:solute symporter [Ponticoccus sp. SC6-9]MBM1223398.1 sodium:solute symporter [Ponticoccus sp. SC6-15]MBM1229343.1 sodium:solute symporter [Ponticoccus sp. SC6-38]MBM1232364.1 sodium:solute symporter [Ponticoccus sp. SC6-45]MBM1237686.1 sodium:solute symporter [Ponticoccus sp. SC6-49]MBM1241375.1 sodium:solute symporter [Ponticoccus sp. SC2-64]MBM1245888.1 sodium:solute symporter [Ponticoccus sp. SC6-42]MBM1250366.1 sodium:so